MSESQLSKARPKEKEYALSDGGGLYLYVLPTGTKVLRFRYVIDGKQKRVPLASIRPSRRTEARNQAAELQSKVVHGVDPAVVPKVVTFESMTCQPPHA